MGIDIIRYFIKIKIQCAKVISSLESSNSINEFSRCLVSRHFFLYGLHGPQMITLPAKDEKSDPSVWQFYSTVTSPPTTEHPDSVWHDFFLPLWSVYSLTVSLFVASIKVFICMLSLFLWRVKSFPSFPNLLLSGTLSVSSMPGEMLPKFFFAHYFFFSGKSKKLPKFPLWHPFCFSDCQIARCLLFITNDWMKGDTVVTINKQLSTCCCCSFQPIINKLQHC